MSVTSALATPTFDVRFAMLRGTLFAAAVVLAFLSAQRQPDPVFAVGETVSTIAGTGTGGFSGDGGDATLAQLNQPTSVALGLNPGAPADVYISDTGNCRIRKVVQTQDGTPGTITNRRRERYLRIWWGWWICYVC